jgi:regulator of replication initiation timing
MDAETRLAELRAVIREEVVRELIGQISAVEKQLVNCRAELTRLNLENDALRLDLHFFESSFKEKGHVKPN